jgi:hypothetical protein
MFQIARFAIGTAHHGENRHGKQAEDPNGDPHLGRLRSIRILGTAENH